jgi:molecular chaperone GrpE (heat shock protein)
MTSAGAKNAPINRNMINCSEPPLPGRAAFAAFWAGDVLLLIATWLLFQQAHRPMLAWETGGLLLGVVLAAGFGVAPFVLQYRAALRLSEADALAGTAGQLKELQQVGASISQAAARLENTQEQATKTETAAREIGERMAAEAKAFAEFMQKANDSEKGHLRLEVEKLRRAEGDWLQVVVHTLDHTFALHQAAVRSGQQSLIDQLGQFQNACRDAARRVGLAPLIPAGGEAFDAKRHQLVEPGGAPAEGARVGETLAAGYSFQGQVIRPALVRLQEDGAAKSGGS